MSSKIYNLNISEIEPLLTPFDLKNELPLSESGSNKILYYRDKIESILNHESKKFMVITGPCSIHNASEALEYAERLNKLNNKLSDKLMIIMRVYFEKPRTTIGWKGLIYDPFLDSTYNMTEGLRTARKLLLDIDKIGLPTATEILDPVTVQYFSDLISWAAIGARTAESQPHRQLVSGLSMPAGFKNSTNGNINTAIEAIQTAMHEHAFIGLLEDGRSGIFHTKGNIYSHIVLRGSQQSPNYSSEHVAYTRELMHKLNITPNIIIDCSHSNSNKTASKQALVLDDVIKQKNNGEDSIVGVMIESNLCPGKQKINSRDNLKYGISITDECIGWEETEELLSKLHESI
ncbi:MAG TPA: 3-deoxy-7-phosphoheptulonate synthase [Victivallales bacterium]|nr:3-deoxy-7-phosphoheptulonate synthase [Victivallales bacterium]